MAGPKTLPETDRLIKNFAKEKNICPWAKVGFAVPFTRNCLNFKRVRKKLRQQNKDDGLKNLQFWYDILVDAVEEKMD